MKKLLITLITTTLFFNSFSQGYETGDKATDFNLLNIDGEYVSLSDYNDAKGFIVIFTCNHCPFSVAYEDRIIAIDKKYKSLGYPVIAVNSNDSTIAETDSYSHMKVRAMEKGFTFPYLLDADQSIAKTYGATRTPHVYLVAKDGKKLNVKYIGAIDDNYEDSELVREKFLENAIDALIAGNNPDPDFTKAIGCTIKFSK